MIPLNNSSFPISIIKTVAEKQQNEDGVSSKISNKNNNQNPLKNTIKL
jgi:hypothetical protein